MPGLSAPAGNLAAPPGSPAILALDVVLFLAAVYLAGYAVLALADRWGVLDEAERMALALPGGAAAVGAVLYTLNVAGLQFTRPLVLGVLAAGTAAGLWQLALRQAELRLMARALRRLSFHPGPLGGLCLAIAVVLTAGHLLNAARDVNHLLDTELYHFPYAAIVFRTHHQPAYATLSMLEEFSFPASLFNLYAALWAVEGRIDQLTPNLLPLPFLLSWLMLTRLAIHRVLRGGDAAVAVSLLLMVATYESAVLVAGESTDLLPIILGAAAAYLVARDLAAMAGNCSHFSLAMFPRLTAAVVLAGLSCCTKYHGVPFAVCMGGGLLLAGIIHRGAAAKPISRQHTSDEGGATSTDPLAPDVYEASSAPGSAPAPLVARLRPFVPVAAALMLGPVLLLLPLLIRNALTFGNPIYPGGCRWLGGFLTTRYAIDVVGAYWQPTQLFYHFPQVIGRTLREPAVVMGIPAVLWALRRRQTPLVFMGCTAALFVAAFATVMSNPHPNSLRFLGPALGILSWFGGWAVTDELDNRWLRRCVVGWAALSTLVVVGISTVDRSILLLPDVRTQLANLYWIAVFVVLFLATASPAARKGAPQLPLLSVAAGVGMMAILIHQPFFGSADLAQDLSAAQWNCTPVDFPLEGWMQRQLPSDAVTYTYYAQRWSMPGSVVAADDPVMEPIHRRGVSLETALECLRKMGVQYVLDYRGFVGIQFYGAYRTDPILHQLGDQRYFEPVAMDQVSTLYRVHYPRGAAAVRPSAADPLPWLMENAAGCGLPPGTTPASAANRVQLLPGAARFMSPAPSRSVATAP